MSNEQYYDTVAKELQGRTIVSGLWTRAYSEADGDEAKARALYIRYRVAQLEEIDNAEAEKSNDERLKNEQHLRRQRFGEWAPQIIAASVFVAVVLIMWLVLK